MQRQRFRGAEKGAERERDRGRDLERQREKQRERGSEINRTREIPVQPVPFPDAIDAANKIRSKRFKALDARRVRGGSSGGAGRGGGGG